MGVFMNVFIGARQSIYKVSSIKDIIDFIQDLNLLTSYIKSVCVCVGVWGCVCVCGVCVCVWICNMLVCCLITWVHEWCRTC